ncbi:Las1-like-domain-containing protein [Fennellomyces sp. T-0311]|nr:Las1-like-domain-containing protein [Fennellomyces sp. T-0311]
MIREVPWSTHDELTQVHDWIYSDSPNTKRQGVDRILAWKSRGRLPSAIETTLQLAQLQLRDCEGCPLSGEELRLQYSMVIVRLVNGSVDSMQNKAHPLPVSIMADRIGMPAWFVDIRHAATHEYLPTLPFLRDAANQALAWLDETYWAAALQTNRILVTDGRKLQEIQQALEAYRKQCTSVSLKNPKKKKEVMPKVRESAIKKMVQVLSPLDIREGLIPALLDNGILIPLEKSRQLAFDDTAIAKELVELWVPLLEALNAKYTDFGTGLFEAMIKRMDASEEYTLTDKFAYLMSAEANSTTPESDNTRSKKYMLSIAYWLKQLIYHDFDDEEAEPILGGVDLDDIIEGCLRSPNYFTRIILQAIADIESEDVSTSLKPFINVIGRHLTSSDNNSQNSNDFNDPMDLDMNEELQELSSRLKFVIGQEPEAEVSNAWRLYDSTEWAPCPLGCLPGGVMPCLDLPE